MTTPSEHAAEPDSWVHVVPNGGPSWLTACGKRVDPGTDERHSPLPENVVPTTHWYGIHGMDYVSCPDCRERMGVPGHV